MISQDTSAYGVDVKHRTGFYNGEPVKTSMVSLCEQLSKLGIWTRLHYVYPYPHVDDVIPLMAEGKILPYLDIPLQHASPRILKLMKRPDPLIVSWHVLNSGAKFARNSHYVRPLLLASTAKQKKISRCCSTS